MRNTLPGDADQSRGIVRPVRGAPLARRDLKHHKNHGVAIYFSGKALRHGSIRISDVIRKNPFTASIKQGRASPAPGSRNPQRHFKALQTVPYIRPHGLALQNFQRRTEFVKCTKL